MLMTPARRATERARFDLLTRYRVLENAVAPLGLHEGAKALDLLCREDEEYTTARDRFVAAVREEENGWRE